MRISEQDARDAGFWPFMPSIGVTYRKLVDNILYELHFSNGELVEAGISPEDDEMTYIALYGIESIDDIRTLERIFGQRPKTVISLED